MDQIKIGAFLKQLRKDHNLTQEQFAEKFGVTQRSVSRWENGNTMPDISILIELADYYEVDLRELLDGERKYTKLDENIKETLEMVADYTDAEKEKLSQKIKRQSIFGMVNLLIYIVLDKIELEKHSFVWEIIPNVCLAFALAAMIEICMYFTGILTKIQRKQNVIPKWKRILLRLVIIIVLVIVMFLMSSVPVHGMFYF